MIGGVKAKVKIGITQKLLFHNIRMLILDPFPAIRYTFTHSQTPIWDLRNSVKSEGSGDY